MSGRVQLPAARYCREEDVRGWQVEHQPGRVALFNPEGEEVSPNCAPGDVRDSFRAFMDGRSK